PLADLPGALGRAGAQAPLQLAEARGVHEDRHRAGHGRLYDERSLGLEVENGCLTLLAHAVDLRAQRADALPPREIVVLEEGALVQEALELGRGAEGVLAPRDLWGSQRPRR